MKPPLAQTIFVMIAAFVDEDVRKTIEDCSAKSKFPEQLRFGVCWQYDSSIPDHEFFLNPILHKYDIQLISYEMAQSQGVGWARNQILPFYRNEDYCLQVDAHSRFIMHWDALLIKNLKELKKHSAKPIISFRPPFYIDTDNQNSPQFQHIDSLDLIQVPVIESVTPEYWFEYREDNVVKSNFTNLSISVLDTSFIFTEGRWIREIPADPQIYYLGEEVALSLRSYTNGWDFYSPTQIVAWHRQMTPEHLKHYTRLPLEIIIALNSQSMQRLKGLIEHRETSEFGLGDSRTLEDYMDFTGVNLYVHNPGRTKPKVFDCFMFYNELEALDIRLTVMDDLVDYFVLVESTQTFTNQTKRLYYEENKSKFNRSKIIHIIVEDSPRSDNPWINEAFQRDCILRGLKQAQPDDVIIISDVDEVPNPVTLQQHLNLLESQPFFSLKQKTFYYFINCLQNQIWLAPTVTLFKHLTSPQKMRKNRFIHPVGADGSGGWHYGYLGGIERIIDKIESSSHQELNKDKFKDEQHLLHCLETGQDLFNRTESMFKRKYVSLAGHSPPGIEKFIDQYPYIYKAFEGEKSGVQIIPSRKLKIAFHSNQLGLRGTEVALYDYAHFNEELLGNESVIISPNPSQAQSSHPLSIDKFKNRFKVIHYHNFSEVEHLLDQEKVDVFYAMKHGYNDGIVSNQRKSIIHAVFQSYQPHGDIYAYISEWLGSLFSAPYVPYMINLPDTNGDLRAELGISKEAIVFGRHGGLKSFDIEFAHEVINQIVNERDDVYFLFMNTHAFIQHERVRFLDGQAKLDFKVRFINTCDAMIHARYQGESFGLAIGEFSTRNKPVITKRNDIVDKAHIDMLGDKGIYYDTANELYSILNQFTKQKHIDWNAFRGYAPDRVMQIFRSVFEV